MKEPRPKRNFFFVGLSAHLRSIWECKSTGNFQRSKARAANSWGNDVGNGVASGSRGSLSVDWPPLSRRYFLANKLGGEEFGEVGAVLAGALGLILLDLAA